MGHRQIILVAIINRTARAKLFDAGITDEEQRRFYVVTDDHQILGTLGLAVATTRWVDLGDSEITDDGRSILNTRFTKAASLDAAIKWLRMPVTA